LQEVDVLENEFSQSKRELVITTHSRGDYKDGENRLLNYKNSVA